MAKGLKLKVRTCLGKLGGELFALSPPPVLNGVKNELTDSRPVKSIKQERDRFHCFIASSVEVTCIATVIMLENMFGNLKSEAPKKTSVNEDTNLKSREIALSPFFFTIFKCPCLG